MAALYSSSSSSAMPQQTFIYRLLLLLTLLPLSLALLAFILQWHGGLTDPTTLWPPDSFQFPGMAISGSKTPSFQRSSSGSVDVLRQSRFLTFPYFKDWKFNLESDLRPKICITSSTSAGLEQTLPWIYYHKVIGVSKFFLFVEGKAAAPNASKVLESVHRIWNESWLASFFYKPCNYELFVKQSLNMEMAIVMARDAGMDWIFHLDTDELMHPAGASEYSLRQLMADVPKDVDMVVFPNHESAVEKDDIREPFSEVSMFKKNYDHVANEVYFGSYKDASHGNDNYFMTYGNGKSAARIQDHLRPNGAHRWHNYKKIPNEMESTEAAVLHYSYSKFSDLTSRRDRCGCKPTMEDLKRCFMLEFDRSAFIIASTATDDEMLRWYREHVVWTDKELKLKLLKRGVLTRIYTPMAIIQGLKESGLFDSIIQSTVRSRNNSSSSIKTGGEESHSNGRRMLEVSKEFSSYDSAIPPLPPPVPDGITM